MRVYHVVTELDTRFKSIQSAERYLSAQSFNPVVPESYSYNEDRITPRLCVARSIEDCITGIGVQRVFFRCLEAWDAPSYGSFGQEQYPIGILEIEVPESCMRVPDKSQVPDVDFTHELWICSGEFEIIDRKIVWIDGVGNTLLSRERERYIAQHRVHTNTPTYPPTDNALNINPTTDAGSSDKQTSYFSQTPV